MPPDLQSEYTAIAEWATSARARFGDGLQINVVDVASVEGVIKALRHRARRFPAFVVDGHDVVRGFDPDRLTAAIERRFAPPSTEASVT